jgi:predicted small lipoprotein YifL
VAVVLPLALGACGRKGSLDPPPSAAVPPPPQNAPGPSGAGPTSFIDPMTPTGGAQQAPVQTTQANPVAQPPKKRFFLDPLIQ